MTRFFTDEEMQKIQNMDKNVLQKNYNNMNQNQKELFGNTYNMTKKFGGFEGKELQGVDGYNENQIGIPGVNMVVKNNLNQNSQAINQNISGGNIQNQTSKIQGMDAVKFRDEPTGNLDLTFDNFLNIKTKLNRGEKLNFSESKLLENIETQNKYFGKSMQEIFGLETKTDKEAKYKNLALENRNIRARDLRNSLASQGLNYDEIEKVVGHHQIYDQLMIEEEKKKQMDEQRLGVYTNVLQKQFAEFENSARKRGEQRMNYLNSSLSFSGFGRSSHALERRDEVITSVNDEIAKQQAVMQAQILEKMAELQGAEPETLANLRKQTMEYTLALQNQQTENAKLAQALNDEANANLTEALNNMIALSGVNPKEVDVERSKLLGFAADKYGNAILKDENGNAIMIRSAIENENEMNYKREKDERDYNYGVYKDERDYNFNVYKDGRDFEYGTYKDERDFGLKTAEFNHKSSMDRAGLQIDYEKLGLEREKFDYGKDKDALDYELKKAEQQGKVSENFIKGNQALFDDIRADTKDFAEINRQYSIMKNAWEAYQKGDKSNKGTVEQQLITVFNKMMDPGSVVREGEFDRTAQGQAIIARFEEQVKRLNQGGAGISDKVLKDLVDGAELMFNSGKQTMLNKKENLKANAYHLGADPSFVDSYFNRETGLYSDKDEKNIDEEWETERKDYGPFKRPDFGPVSPLEINKNTNLKLKPNFPKADQTALTKEIPKKAIQIAFSVTRKKGQCGAFVNDYVQKLTGKRIMGDSYESKEKHINSDTPQLGGLAVWNPGGGIKEYGHTGIVTGISGDYVIIRDANWKGDEKVMTRKVPIKTILASRGGGKGGFVNFA